MNQLEHAKNATITKAMEVVAASEGVDPRSILEEFAQGHLIIPRNKNHASIAPLGIGKGLRTKINANIGTSKDHQDLEEELKKLSISIEAGADTVMDLSTGGPLDEIRRAILKETTVPIGTVPIYQAVVETVQQHQAMVKIGAQQVLRTRPVFHDWSVVMKIIIDEQVFDERTMISIIEDAGRFVGLCEKRPRLGRFTVEKI